MEHTKNQIVEQIKAKIQSAKLEPKMKTIGSVIEVGDGIARISGLGDCMVSEMLSFQCAGEKVVYGMALNLEEGVVGAVLFAGAQYVREGDRVESTGRILDIPVGNKMLGRVVNALGQPVDGKGDIAHDAMYPVEKVAPGVIVRAPVDEPMQTGIKVIDAMIPVGRGQRELIIGDRQTGKTAICIDTIINQKNTGVKCVYVAIGQKESKIARIISQLETSGASAYTTVVLAGASETATMSYLAPYTGCAIAEYFMDQGEDVLIVYDDLSKHAIAYRELSLILRRPPGREAYPGDIFYLHSRLLERAAKLSDAHGGGSITALPIIETQAGDISAYIPTNVISITDGQIFLESDLFYQGIRPAVNAGLSVSRVGSAAQTKGMKQVGGRLKMDLSQYRELAGFAQFGSDVDESTRRVIERGKRLTELLKQEQYKPLSVAEQVISLYTVNNGFMDTIAVVDIRKFESGLLSYVALHGAHIFEVIMGNKKIEGDTENELKKLIVEYTESFA